MMEKSTHVYSAEIKEIVGEPPKWLLKSGGGSLLLLLLMLGILSAFTHYPDKKTISIKIYREQNAYVMTRKLQVMQFLKTSGQQVNKGDTIALALHNGAHQTIKAPFAGRILYEDTALNNNSDTLAMLVPTKGTYRFRGEISTEYALLLTHAKANPFKIIPANQVDKDLEVYGKLTAFGPLKSNNMLNFTGVIDESSGKMLDKNYVAISNLSGQLTFIVDNKTILSRILH